MSDPYKHRETVGNFAFEIQVHPRSENLWYCRFHREDEIGWTRIYDEDLTCDDFAILLAQARLKMREFFVNDAEREDWGLYITGQIFSVISS